MANNEKQKTLIKVGPFVGSYVTLYEPRAVNEGDEPKYSISMIVPKNLDPKSPAGKSFAQLKQMIDFVAKQKYGPDYKKIPNFHNPVRDGDVDRPDAKEYAEAFFFNCSAKRQPGLVDRHLKKIISKEEHNDRAYSGCKFVVQVNVYPFPDRVKKKGVALGLNNVAVVEQGERIDGRQDAAEAFAGDFEEAGGGEAEGGEGEVNPLD